MAASSICSDCSDVLTNSTEEATRTEESSGGIPSTTTGNVLPSATCTGVPRTGRGLWRHILLHQLFFNRQ